MEGDARSRFRIRTWPERPISAPSTWSDVGHTFHEGAFWWNMGAPELLPSRVVDEVYLQVAALDLENVAHIEEFVGRFGILGAEAETSGGFTVSDFRGLTLLGDFTPVQEELSAARTRALENPPPGGQYRLTETLEAFRFAATSIKDLVSMWRFANEGVPPASWTCPVWDYAPEIDSAPDTPRRAAEMLNSGTGDALATFHPAIAIEAPGSVPFRAQVSEEPVLFDVCCLQLFNHIVESAAYKTCANEPCGRLFVRQRGRAKHGQYRVAGVKYCSSECARAQARREYRRRVRDRLSDLHARELDI